MKGNNKCKNGFAHYWFIPLGTLVGTCQREGCHAVKDFGKLQRKERIYKKIKDGYFIPEFLGKEKGF